MRNEAEEIEPEWIMVDDSVERMDMKGICREIDGLQVFRESIHPSLFPHVYLLSPLSLIYL